jgi:hypothetical protein
LIPLSHTGRGWRIDNESKSLCQSDRKALSATITAWMKRFGMGVLQFGVKNKTTIPVPWLLFESS